MGNLSTDEQLIDAAKRRYVRCCDGRDLDGLLAVFTEDATLTVGSGLVWTGRDEIAAGYRGAFASPAGMHVVSTGVVHVTGDSATGSWYMQRMSLDAVSGGLVQLGVYDDTLVRSAAGWAISSMQLTITWSRPPS